MRIDIKQDPLRFQTSSCRRIPRRFPDGCFDTDTAASPLLQVTYESQPTPRSDIVFGTRWVTLSFSQILFEKNTAINDFTTYFFIPNDFAFSIHPSDPNSLMKDRFPSGAHLFVSMNRCPRAVGPSRWTTPRTSVSASRWGRGSAGERSPWVLTVVFCTFISRNDNQKFLDFFVKKRRPHSMWVIPRIRVYMANPNLYDADHGSKNQTFIPTVFLCITYSCFYVYFNT